MTPTSHPDRIRSRSPYGDPSRRSATESNEHTNERTDEETLTFRSHGSASVTRTRAYRKSRCQACGTPMIVVEPEQKTHPNCDEWANAGVA